MINIIPHDTDKLHFTLGCLFFFLFILFNLFYADNEFCLIYLTGGGRERIHSSCCSLLMIIFNSKLFHVHFSLSNFTSFFLVSGENNFSCFSLAGVCTLREDETSLFFALKQAFKCDVDEGNPFLLLSSLDLSCGAHHENDAINPS